MLSLKWNFGIFDRQWFFSYTNFWRGTQSVTIWIQKMVSFPMPQSLWLLSLRSNLWRTTDNSEILLLKESSTLKGQRTMARIFWTDSKIPQRFGFVDALFVQRSSDPKVVPRSKKLRSLLFRYPLWTKPPLRSIRRARLTTKKQKKETSTKLFSNESSVVNSVNETKSRQRPRSAFYWPFIHKQITTKLRCILSQTDFVVKLRVFLERFVLIFPYSQCFWCTYTHFSVLLSLETSFLLCCFSFIYPRPSTPNFYTSFGIKVLVILFTLFNFQNPVVLCFFFRYSTAPNFVYIFVCWTPPISLFLGDYPPILTCFLQSGLTTSNFLFFWGFIPQEFLLCLYLYPPPQFTYFFWMSISPH